MLKKEAERITGGLSKPGKMPEGSYNIPASSCQTGQILAKVKDTPCEGCYALKGRYRFPNVQQALRRRLDSITHPDWIRAMVVLIDNAPWFRWHDSGDLQGPEHLKKIFEVCKLTPSTQHWLPTREAGMLKLMDPDIVPPNLIIRLSGHMIDGKNSTFWPWTSSVSSQGKTCPALDQGNSCRDCRACWDRKVDNVTYPKH